MDYTSLVNNSLLNIVVGVILVFVLLVCIIFLRKGWAEARRLGVTEKELKKIVLSSIGISLVPSIPIVISAIVMVPALGVALPWLRTSVIGSASTELIAATAAVDATGVELSADSMTIEAWINAAWAMMLGCSVALPIVLVVLKPVCRTYDTFRHKDSRWISIFSLCALVTVIGAYSVNYMFKGVVPCLVIVTCLVFAYICTLLAQKDSLKWVKDYSFPMTILFGLIVAMVATPLVG